MKQIIFAITTLAFCLATTACGLANDVSNVSEVDVDENTITDDHSDDHSNHSVVNHGLTSNDVISIIDAKRDTVRVTVYDTVRNTVELSDAAYIHNENGMVAYNGTIHQETNYHVDSTIIIRDTIRDIHVDTMRVTIVDTVHVLNSDTLYQVVIDTIVRQRTVNQVDTVYVTKVDTLHYTVTRIEQNPAASPLPNEQVYYNTLSIDSSLRFILRKTTSKSYLELFVNGTTDAGVIISYTIGKQNRFLRHDSTPCTFSIELYGVPDEYHNCIVITEIQLYNPYSGTIAAQYAGATSLCLS